MGETTPDPVWVTRARAQELLGLGRAQVDNLRRRGVLISYRNPHTGRVTIRVDSINRLLKLRTLGQPGAGSTGRGSAQ